VVTFRSTLNGIGILHVIARSVTTGWSARNCRSDPLELDVVNAASRFAFRATSVRFASTAPVISTQATPSASANPRNICPRTQLPPFVRQVQETTI
jgi:hypothetical protein